jgi:hypothetical protein
MRTAILTMLLAAVPVCLAAQEPAAQPASASSDKQNAPAAEKANAADPLIFKSEGNFTFSYPADWEIVDTKPMLPVERLKAQQGATSQMERKGAACTDVQLTIRHGDPRSVILIMYLAYSCLGVELKPSDLGATGAGIAQGLTKPFNVKDPKYGAYMLGKHAFWIERADGSPVDHPEREYKLETTCTLLNKGLACWLALAANPDAITTFEASKVALEGDPSVALVPASAFATGR